MVVFLTNVVVRPKTHPTGTQRYHRLKEQLFSKMALSFFASKLIELIEKVKVYQKAQNTWQCGPNAADILCMLQLRFLTLKCMEV